MLTAAPAPTTDTAPDTTDWRDLLCHYGGHVYAFTHGAVVCLRCGGVPPAPPRA